MPESAPGTELVRADRPTEQPLTAAAFQGLATVPPEIEWFANLGNKATRRAYENALRRFTRPSTIHSSFDG
jgi:hypothetical protein